MTQAVFHDPVNRIKPDPSWTSLLENAVREVFDIMLSAQVVPVSRPPEGPAGTVIAVIGLAGQLAGVLSMDFTLEGAERIARKMLSVDALKSPHEMNDAIGEICNMVAGSFKAKIPGLGDGCLLSVPTVIRGNDFQCHPLTDGESFEICLAHEGRQFWVVLGLNR